MTRTRRGGLTLVEVLVTIFIMGIGLLAILTLFPLAAINMARAVKDDRSYQLARATDAMFRAYWNAEIVEKAGAGDSPLFNALDNPGTGMTGTPLPAPGLYEWSYPVVVDPAGVIARPNLANPGALPDWVGDTRTNVPRRSMALFYPPRIAATASTNQAVLSAMYLKDTVGYDDDLHLTADREYRYNAMVVIQRPLNRNRYAANMTVVVFDDRAPLFAPAGAEQVVGATFTPGTTTITVNVPAANLTEVRQGSWVMDATVTPPGVTAGRPAIRNANLYQIVSVTPDQTNPNVTYLEVQEPVRTTEGPGAGPYNGTLVIMKGVSGVFPRAPLSPGE